MRTQRGSSVTTLIETTQTSVALKKERGRKHYESRKTRIAERIARSKRTRSSDISPRRTGEGIAPNHHLRMKSMADVFGVIRK
jgi:hypothetical protein